MSASDDRTLRVWDLKTNVETRELSGRESVRAVAVTLNGRWAVSASNDHELKVWDLQAGVKVCEFLGHTDLVKGVAVSPDGRRAISASRDKRLMVWELKSGKLLATFTCDDELSCCAFVDDRQIVAGDWGGRIHLLSLEKLRAE